MTDDLPPPAPMACIGADPTCPCQDGAACHYRDAADGTKGWPIPVPPLPTAAWTARYPKSVVGDPDTMYTADQMRAYARAAVEAQRAEHGMAAHEFRPTIDKALAELDAREKIELLRELLREALPGLQGLRPRRRQRRSDD